MKTRAFPSIKSLGKALIYIIFRFQIVSSNWVVGNRRTGHSSRIFAAFQKNKDAFTPCCRDKAPLAWQHSSFSAQQYTTMY